MVYLHFPSNLTEEELMLQAKYQKLKKKKKAVVALKTAKPENPVPGTGTVGARDAREYARKLLKSGAIGALSPAAGRAPQAFKRPRAARDRRPGAHFTPFGAGTIPDVPIITTPSAVSDDGDTSEVESTKPTSSLYDSFVVARDKEERSEPQKNKGGGNTVFVSGHKISEEFLRKHLGLFGSIVNVSMEIEKHRGFVTFEKHEIARKVIDEMNGTTAGGIQLEVSMARRQPQMERINEASSSSAWCTLAASQSLKGPHRDGRSVVSYEDLFSG